MTAADGPLVVRAGAGSGKTTVIVERVVHLVAERGLRPGAVLVVTFSRRARQELVERLTARLPEHGPRVAVTTLHALGRRIILQWPDVVGYRPGRLAVYGPRDRDLVLDEARRGLDLPTSAGAPDRLAAAVEAVRLGLPPPADADAPAERDLPALAARYEELLRQRNAIDFVAMVTLPPRLLDAHPAGLALLQTAYACLLCDEGQDLSRDQIGLLLRLAAGHRHLTVVGDVCQAIYGFRGGEPRLLTEFAAHFPDAREVVLDVNYRSTAPIVATGNALVAGLPDGHRLVSAVGDGPPVVVHRAPDERAEAAWVAAEIARLLAAGAIGGLVDVAVLYRTHAQAGPLVAALRAAGLPCHRRRPGAELAAGREVAEALAYLRLLLDPDDIVALRRVLNVPERGLGLLAEALAEGTAATLAEVQALSDRLDVALGRAGEGGLAVRLATFLAPLDRLRPRAGRLSVGLFDALLDAVGYLAWLRRGPGAGERLAALDELRGALDGASDDPAAWLADLAADDLAPPSAGAGVTLSSIHSVKGSEFTVVFAVGLEEGVLPDFRALADPAALQGEAAVLYVAVTRARRHLYLSHCATRRRGGEARPAQPSRFLAHLPAADLAAG